MIADFQPSLALYLYNKNIPQTGMRKKEAEKLCKKIGKTKYCKNANIGLFPPFGWVIWCNDGETCFWNEIHFNSFLKEEERK